MIRQVRDSFSHRTWRRKFAVAFRGIRVGLATQPSFWVHLPAAALVLLLASFLSLSLVQWAVLILCAGSVLALELMNTGLESLSRAVTREENPWIRDALDMASGAVLLAALTAAAVGSLVLLPGLLAWVTR